MEKGKHEDKVAAVAAAHSFGFGDAADLARESVAASYAKSDLSSLYGKSVAGVIKDKETKRPIDMEKTLRDNFGSIAPQAIAGSENYAKSVASAYAGAGPDKQAAMDRTLRSIESTPQLIGSMTENGKAAIRGINGHEAFGMGAPVSGGPDDPDDPASPHPSPPPSAP